MVAGVRGVRDAVLAPAVVATVTAPRTGLVTERAVADAPGTFEITQDGVVRDYRRHVEVLEQHLDGSARVRQTVTASVSIPWFGWLFARPLRGLLGSFGDRAAVWWLPPDWLDRRAVESIASLCALAATAAYLSVLLSQTITYAADEFGVSTAAQGVALAVVLTDIFIALGIIGIADRRGRTAAVKMGLGVAAVAAAAGGLAPNLPALVGTQVVSRGFLAAASISIAVLAAEELPAGSRAYGVTLLSATGSLGVGTALVLLPLADTGGRGWRLLFLAALAIVPMVRAVARRLPESRRFIGHRDARIAGHGGRLWLLGGSALLFGLFSTPAFQFQNEYLRDERGFSALSLSLFTVATGLPGGIGLIVGGQLADRHGRRAVGAVAAVAGVGLTTVMFLVSGWPLWGASVAASVFGAAAIPAIGVYGPELFPTAVRGRANALLSGLGRVGGVVGLVAAGWLADRNGALGPGLALLAVGPLVVAFLIATRYPETAHQELEALNPEDAPPAA
jgi:putative MFS transporter